MNRALAGKMASAGVDQLIELINHRQMERVRNLIKPHATAVDFSTGRTSIFLRAK
jgi:hypothetical protein